MPHGLFIGAAVAHGSMRFATDVYPEWPPGIPAVTSGIIDTLAAHPAEEGQPSGIFYGKS
jgi:hypothetical protein